MFFLKHAIQRPDGLLRAGRISLQRERDAQRVVFGLAKYLERQQLKPFQIGELPRKRGQRADMRFPIGEARHHHMPEPQRHAQLRGLPQKREDRPQAAAAITRIRLFGGEFQIAEYQRGVGEYGARAGRVADTGGIKRRVDTRFPQEAEQPRHKTPLQQRLAARYGDAAGFAEIGAVTQNLFKERLRRRFLAAVRKPGVRVMAIGAAQRTALHEDHRAQAGAVYRAEALERVDAPGDARSPPCFRRIDRCAVHIQRPFLPRVGFTRVPAPPALHGTCGKSLRAAALWKACENARHTPKRGWSGWDIFRGAHTRPPASHG